jgi:Fic family protein
MDFDKLIKKKGELDSFRPLPQAMAENLYDWFLIELTYTNNAIDGNTLTRLETAFVVEKGLAGGEKSLKEYFEACNHAIALQWIKTLEAESVRDIDEDIILQIHRYILQTIDDANAGLYRDIPVRISDSPVIFPGPLKVTDLMADFIAWIHSSSYNPIELAALAHYKLVTIRPFVSGNGRTARLLMNLILMMHGYPPAIIRPEDRLAYIKSLESAQLGESLDKYIALIFKAVDHSLDIYLKAVKKQDSVVFEEATNAFKIDQMSLEAGIPIATLKFWLQEELLDIASTSPCDYWLFGDTD